jgi:hypothetical protein
MSTHKHKVHLVKIKEAVTNSDDFSSEEKTDTIKRIDEWLLEDRADGIFLEELLELASGVRPIFKELGLL